MKDKNGVELKVGDYALYSEMPLSNYADSLVTIIKHNDVIKLQSLVHNRNCGGKVEYCEMIEPLENCVDIKYCNPEKDLEKVFLGREETPFNFLKLNYPNGVTLK